ncbi:MAG: DUF4265 domain-containing protein [Planctomycetes bacterium]|nr:DUF4265 domain-containing protein [Planctomycetota bacterium]
MPPDDEDSLIRVTVRLAADWTESLWARQITKDTARIDSLPRYAPHVTLGSLVRVDEQGHVLYVLEHTARNAVGRYEAGTSQEIEERYQAIHDYLAAHDIPCAGFESGRVAMCVPNDISPSRLRELLARCPVPVRIERDFGRRGGPR